MRTWARQPQRRRRRRRRRPEPAAEAEKQAAHAAENEAATTAGRRQRLQRWRPGQGSHRQGRRAMSPASPDGGSSRPAPANGAGAAQACLVAWLGLRIVRAARHGHWARVRRVTSCVESNSAPAWRWAGGSRVSN
eukprot:scaffold14424_cov105-Isochrysis_galbana.AAC.5